MKKQVGMNKKWFHVILAVVLLIAVTAGAFADTSGGAASVRLERSDWNDDVKNAVNDMLDLYGAEGKTPAEKPYAVFDFDNTCSIFDMEEQTVVYQLQTMAFEIAPEQMKEIMLTGIPDVEADRSSYGYFKGSFNDLADDIAADYKTLWDQYGPFTANGVSSETAAAMAKDPCWQDFAPRVFMMYEATGGICSHDVSYPWMTYLFTGMTEEEVYALTTRALEEYSKKETSEVTWESPEGFASKTGPVSYTWTSGVSVSKNINELWEALDKNGIDVWVCSASVTGVIKAAIDFFGLHEYCTGMLGMTDKKDDDDRFINEYDYETGCGYYATETGWEHMSAPIKVQTQGEGKVLAIENAIAPEYDGRGPIAGFMDSSGDFNFCTEFDTLKLVICFNRATRGVTEGGGLVAETAIYQKETLGYDFAKADEAGDTLYLLQGRDENGKRALRNSSSTLRYGQKEETLFKGEENYTQLDMFEDESLSTEDVFDTWALTQDAESSDLGFETGFLEVYDGYHSHTVWESVNRLIRQFTYLTRMRSLEVTP